MTYSADAPAKSDSPAGKHEGLAHVMPVPVLLAVFGALMVLTVLTVAVSQPKIELGNWSLELDFGGWHLAIAMAIATLKATLVALYFMHLRYDHPFNAVIFLTALLFLGLFLSLIMLDTIQYQPDIDAIRIP